MSIGSINGVLILSAVKRIALLPLDGSGRLARNVVDDAVDATYFVDDAVRNPRRQVVRQMCPVRSHEIQCFNCAQCGRRWTRTPSAYVLANCRRATSSTKIRDKISASDADGSENQALGVQENCLESAVVAK